MKKVKLSLKDRLVKSLEVRMNNLKKKMATVSGYYKTERKEIRQEMEFIAIQLNALRKK